MTIDERAREWCDSIINRLDTSDLYRGYVQGAVEESAKFKDYLEKKRVDIQNLIIEYEKRGYMTSRYENELDLLKEIINELSKEE